MGVTFALLCEFCVLLLVPNRFPTPQFYNSLPDWNSTVDVLNLVEMLNNSSYKGVLAHFEDPNFRANEIGENFTLSGSVSIDNVEKRFGESSLRSQGTGYASIPPSPNLNAAGDFTISFWAKWDTLDSWAVAVGSSYSGGRFVIYAGSNTILMYFAHTGNIVSIPSLTLSQWYHIAVTRKNDTLRFFVDGLQYYELPGQTWLFDPNGIDLGNDRIGTPLGWTGNIDEFLYLPDFCLYDTEFIPPTSAFSYTRDDYKLLMHFDGSDFLKDEMGHAVTNVNVVQAIGEGMFDDGADSDQTPDPRLIIPASADWSFEDDFTIDAWVQFKREPEFPGCGIVNTHNAFSTCEFGLYYQHNIAGSQQYLAFIANDFLVKYDPFVPVLDQWYHIAATRKSGVIRLFLDGEIVAEESYANNITNSIPLTIGNTNNTESTRFPGIIDEVRILNGRAEWDAPFTPPAHPYLVSKK